MKAVWIKIGDDTSAMEVPGGIVIRSHYPCGSVSIPVGLVFVPGVRLDCSKMEQTGVAELAAGWGWGDKP